MMIKEYILKLINENSEDLEKLEKQMKDMLGELSCAEEWSETLQIESNSQKNIFSPRNADPEINTKIEKATNSVQKIKKEIEYIRDLIETHLKKREEYAKMLSEIENSEKIYHAEKHEREKNEFSDTDKSKKIKTENADSNLNKEKYPHLKDEQKECEKRNLDGDIAETEKSMESAGYINFKEQTEEMKAFLSNLYSKTEVCLACLISDKNRCKKELNEMKNIIKKYAKELEKR